MRLCEAETADGFALLQERQPFIFLRVAAVGINRIHHQRALHGNKTAEAGVAALEFLGHQAVGDVGHAGAAVAMEVGAEKSKFAQLRDQMLRKSGFAAVFFDDGNDFVFDEFARSLADEFFLVIQLRIEFDEIHSAKFGHALVPFERS